MAGDSFRTPFRAVLLRRKGAVRASRGYRRRRRARPADRLVVLLALLVLGSLTAVYVWGGSPPGMALTAPGPKATDPEAARFGKCWGRHGDNCVIDGDSLIYAGRQIRIADIDAPELGSPGCAQERELGEQAEDRLQSLLNQGPFSLEPAERATDRYGRALFVITRKGRSLGDMLVNEGLAHEWHGHKLGWC